MRISRLTLPLMLAFSGATAATASAAVARPLVTYSAGGGQVRCNPKTCIVSITIDAAGNVRFIGKQGKELSAVALGAKAGSRLARLIATTPLERLHPKPFTGTCPIAYDGIEKMYSIRKAAKVFRFDSCKVVIPKLPLIRQIDQMLQRAYAKQPLTR